MLFNLWKALAAIMGTNISRVEDTTSVSPTTQPSDLCPDNHSEYVSIGFWLNAVFGGSVCIIGLGFNIALLQVLCQRELRKTYLIYLAALALMDIGIIITYILLVAVVNVYEYFQSYTLFLVWHSYVRFFYTLSRIVTLASTYLVVVCTVERYWEVINLKARRRVNKTQTERYVIVACVILVSIAFRSIVFMEVTVDVHPECQGTMGYMVLNRTDLINDYAYSKVYSFWAVHLAHVFVPFPALVFLNVAITLTWRQVLNLNRRGSMEVRKMVKQSQSARHMMVAIVTSYLVCNTLHFILTCWEHIDMEFLKRHGDFYAYASDAVTLLTTINASFRLPIYYASNLAIRTAIKNLWFTKRMESVYTYTRSKASLIRKRSLRYAEQLHFAKSDSDRGQYALINNNNLNQNGYMKEDPETKYLQECPADDSQPDRKHQAVLHNS